MEKTIVIYESKYGSTKRYAQWIQEELKCNIKPLSEIKTVNLNDYDNIIFGGGVHAGGISGWDRFQKLVKKDLKEIYHRRLGDEGYVPKREIVVFACGINIKSFETKSQLREVNFDKAWLKGITCFFLDGAYNPDKVKGIDNMIMKVMKKFLKDKGLNRTKEEDILLENVTRGCDFVCRENIRGIVEFFNNR